MKSLGNILPKIRCAVFAVWQRPLHLIDVNSGGRFSEQCTNAASVSSAIWLQVSTWRRCVCSDRSFWHAPACRRHVKREESLFWLCACVRAPVCIHVAWFVCLCKEGRNAPFQEVIEGPSNGKRLSWKCEGDGQGSWVKEKRQWKTCVAHAHAHVHTHTHTLLYYYCTYTRSQMWAVYTALISSDSTPTSTEQLHKHTHMHTHTQGDVLTNQQQTRTCYF